MKNVPPTATIMALNSPRHQTVDVLVFLLACCQQQAKRIFPQEKQQIVNILSRSSYAVNVAIINEDIC
jgi:hypothetical protein